MSPLLTGALREALLLLLLGAAPPLLAGALAGAAVELAQGRFAVREPAAATFARIGAGLLLYGLAGFQLQEGNIVR